MANAIKQISVQRGHDVTGYTLATFGGAGGQHACLVADALAMTRVFIHPLAGVLSAYGMGLAEQTAMREQTVEALLTEAGLQEVEARLQQLAEAAAASLESQGVPRAAQRVARRVHLKYDGTDTALAVPAGTVAAMTAAFETAYRQRFSFLMPDKAIVVESVSVEAAGGAAADTPDVGGAAAAARRREPLVPAARVQMFADGRWHDAPLYRRQDILPGDRITGPAIIAEANATTVVDPGWQAEAGSPALARTAEAGSPAVARSAKAGHLCLTRVQPRPQRRAIGTDADPVMLEVFNNLFMSIAEQMGLRLQNTAYSVNIKERLDFSCALFDAEGSLIANAPHMPVHLGSMSESIKTVRRENAGRMQPGDAYVVNDPYHGGTHLPDITVITPVFDAAGREILFYVGSRGHHADVGGTTPGSMPPDSRTVDEEGVLFTNWKLVERGHLREAETLRLLRSGTHPARNPEQNMADLRAQIAANEKGVRELAAMVDHFGLPVVQAYMRHVQDNAEEAVRRVITALKDGEFRLELDSGAAVQVKVIVRREEREATIDFTGTSAQQPDNFNAPAAISTAAVLYVFRTLVDDQIPLNSGCLKPLRIVIPERSMLKPDPPAAVVAGNVETSQCITNALYGALGVMAAGQCTMNNFTFGNPCHQYYETISGGSGAGPGFDGTAVVQTHMTNSRLTDPEVLEWRYPVRVESYEIRHGSGGRGKWRGGDGGVRRIRFLEAMTASILANNRRHGAFGMAGGEPGQPGRNWVERAGSGERVDLDYIGSAEMGPGDVFVIETPAGGGYGAE
jgi:5-oxoprolinase (ATP-hydrolysing)